MGQAENSLDVNDCGILKYLDELTRVYCTKGKIDRLEGETCWGPAGVRTKPICDDRIMTRLDGRKHGLGTLRLHGGPYGKLRDR